MNLDNELFKKNFATFFSNVYKASFILDWYSGIGQPGVPDDSTDLVETEGSYGAHLVSLVTHFSQKLSGRGRKFKSSSRYGDWELKSFSSQIFLL